MKPTAWILALVCASAGAATAGEPRNVAIVVYPGVELLDFSGPGEVFSSAEIGRAHV